MSEPLIQLEHVTKLYGSVIGINDVSLSLGEGAYGLLGPNGSGKTTLLNLLIGQLRPTIGKVTVLGQEPWGQPNLFREIGICPAADILFHQVSGREWVTYMTQLHDIPSAEADRLALEALERVGLQDAMHRPIGSYSKGMKQRAKLAQAISHQPRLLVLDEPFNGLDPIARHELSSLLRDWPHAGGRCLILASHILHEVEAISPSFLLIRGGRLLASGRAPEIQSLLSEFPDEIVVKTPMPRQVARLLVDRGVVDTLEINAELDMVRFATHDGLTVYRSFAAWIAEAELEVSEFSSANDSLQSLFNALLRLHRGEAL